MKTATRFLPVLFLSIFVAACAPADSDASDSKAAGTDALPRGLLVALSQFEVSPEGKALPRPKAASFQILTRRDGSWTAVTVEDPESNVFHKAMVYDPGRGGPGILTLGGTAAALKLWRPGPGGLTAETLWKTEFGGKFNRMREAEIVDLGDGKATLAVATHDQGVVALVSPGEDGTYEVRELDRQKSTVVHEIEIGDLDGDGASEIYATPSEPNMFDGKPQRGKVIRFVPGRDGKREIAADLGDRHAKEILVEDVDGDGRDELYVSVEAVQGGQLQIRRYDGGTDPAEGEVIARMRDRLCRFLTPGDLDGDGKLEIVAATHKSGLWLLRPPTEAGGSWTTSSIDRDSSGFEHAALATDLDGDGVDELYVASDDQGEIRSYVWRGGEPHKEVLLRRDVPDAWFTWSLMPVPVDLVGGTP